MPQGMVAAVHKIEQLVCKNGIKFPLMETFLNDDGGSLIYPWAF
jgi:hypothetical protein